MSKVDKEFSLQAVPQGNRNGFWKVLAVMLSLSFFSASMMSGEHLDWVWSLNSSFGLC